MIACSFCGVDIFPEQEERHMSLSHRKRIEREAGSTDALRVALDDAESRLTNALNQERFETDPLWRLRNDLRRALARLSRESDR
jgi:hypothetical protein